MNVPVPITNGPHPRSPPWQVAGVNYDLKPYRTRLQDERMISSRTPNPYQAMSEPALSNLLMKFSKNWTTLQPASVSTWGFPTSTPEMTFFDGVHNMGPCFYGFSDGCLYSVQNNAAGASFIQIYIFESCRNLQQSNYIYHPFALPFHIKAVAIDWLKQEMTLLSMPPHQHAWLYVLSLTKLQFPPIKISPVATFDELTQSGIMPWVHSWDSYYEHNAVISQFEVCGHSIGITISDGSSPRKKDTEFERWRMQIIGRKYVFNPEDCTVSYGNFWTPLRSPYSKYPAFYFISEFKLLVLEMQVSAHGPGQQAKLLPSFRVLDLLPRNNKFPEAWMESTTLSTFSEQHRLLPGILRRVSFVPNIRRPLKEDAQSQSLNPWLTKDLFSPAAQNGPFQPDPDSYLVGLKFELYGRPDAVFVFPLQQFRAYPWDKKFEGVVQMPPCNDFHLNGNKAIWRETNGANSVIKCRDFTPHHTRTDTLGVFGSTQDPLWLTQTEVGDQLSVTYVEGTRHRGTVATSTPQVGMLRLVVHQDCLLMFRPGHIVGQPKYALAARVLSF